MKLNICYVLLFGLLIVPAVAQQSNVPRFPDPIAVLKSDATDADAIHQKVLACQQLAELGTPESADALAPLLTDSRLCTNACIALVNLPANADGKPAGLKPLLDAVPRLVADPNQAGNLLTVVNALGQLRNPEAVDVLKSLDTKDNPKLSNAITIALERIATEPSQLVPMTSVEFPNMASLRKSWPTLADLDRLYKADCSGDTKAQEELTLLCRICKEQDALVDALVTKFASANETQKVRIVSLIAEVGTRHAAEALAKFTEQNDSAVTDCVTKALGDWDTIDAADSLYKIAQSCPEEKFKIRALRGYIRMARQMGGVTFDTKQEMLKKASAIATRQEEKDLIAHTLNDAILPAREKNRIFDGKTFTGWEGNTEKWFRIENGTIIGGTFKERIPRNEFLATKTMYGDFVLTLECKQIGQGGNAGVQFRSIRVPNSNEMSGYQADLTSDGQYAGKLYDESRRNRFLIDTDDKARMAAFKVNDWNEYKIVCEGKRIRIYLNGLLTVDYTEQDDTIPLKGYIGLQIHGGGPSEVYYRNIFLERLD